MTGQRRAALAVAAWLSVGTAAAQDPPAAGAPELDKKQIMAAKLAGLAGFVNVACPELRAVPEKLAAAVERLGLALTDLDGGPLQSAAHAYVEAYRRDVAANCKRAIETFGPESAVVPGLIVRR